MGLFDFLKKKGDVQFVPESDFEQNLAKQVAMTPQTMDQLRKIDVSATRELKLEFFFYTNTISKAQQLALELGKINYTVSSGQSAGDKKLFIVTGWTIPMKMTDEVVAAWAARMCEIGYTLDCKFDGWGTTPDQ